MLKSINTIYLLGSTLLYFMLFPKLTGEYLLLNYFTFFGFISYYIMLQLSSSMSSINYKNKYYLWLEVFVYSFFFVLFYNVLSYYYNENFFSFNEGDALGYHFFTIEVIDNPSFIDGIKHYLERWDVADLGIILVLYPLYLIVQSNLILNFFYIFVGAFTALSIFNISRDFMTPKYAFMGALAYTLSSFALYFHSTGLKESFMVMITVLTFDFYQRFSKANKIIYLVLFLVFGLMLFLFRPAIFAMILAAIGVSIFLSNKKGIVIKILPYLIVVVSAILWQPLSVLVLTYMNGGYDALIEAKNAEGLIIGGIPFTYMVNILAQSVGPLPSLVSENHMQVYNSQGLIYRVLLAFPFWMGILYIFKTKNYIIYPLALFALIEMSALTFLFEGLELRKSMTQLPIVFIIAFWFLDQYDGKIIKFKKKKRFKRFFYTSMSILFLFIFYWNFR